MIRIEIKLYFVSVTNSKGDKLNENLILIEVL